MSLYNGKYALLLHEEQVVFMCKFLSFISYGTNNSRMLVICHYIQASMFYFYMMSKYYSCANFYILFVTEAIIYINFYFMTFKLRMLVICHYIQARMFYFYMMNTFHSCANLYTSFMFI